MTNVSNTTTPTLNEQLLAMEAPVSQSLSWQAAAAMIGTAGLGLWGGHQLWREYRAGHRQDAQLQRDLDDNVRLNRFHRGVARRAEAQAAGAGQPFDPPVPHREVQRRGRLAITAGPMGRRENVRY